MAIYLNHKGVSNASIGFWMAVLVSAGILGQWPIGRLPSMEILGQAAPGKSTGEAMELMEQLASKLPTGVGYDWTGMSYQERLSGNQAPSLYAISLIVVFLCLAALYESWSIPFSVMLVVPLFDTAQIHAEYAAHWALGNESV